MTSAILHVVSGTGEEDIRKHCNKLESVNVTPTLCLETEISPLSEFNIDTCRDLHMELKRYSLLKYFPMILRCPIFQIPFLSSAMPPGNPVSDLIYFYTSRPREKGRLFCRRHIKINFLGVFLLLVFI